MPSDPDHGNKDESRAKFYAVLVYIVGEREK